jgi:DNA-binding NtrC family response regulator
VLETKRVIRVGGSKEIEVDVRVLASTHRDLEGMCREGRFREDLLYRLNAMTLRIPPLCERPEDIVPLATHFLRQACRNSQRVVKAISPRALELLVRYQWPGNVRELRNVIERAVVVAESEVITEADLSDRLRPGPDPLGGKARVPGEHSTKEIAVLAPETEDEPAGEDPDVDFKDRVREFETRLILSALKVSQWNQTEAARRLRMPLRTLVHKIKAYGIKASR